MGQVANLRTDCQSVQPGAGPAVRSRARRLSQPGFLDFRSSETRLETCPRLRHKCLSHAETVGAVGIEQRRDSELLMSPRDFGLTGK